ncbi:MAG: SapC family protein [Phenylobacterium sp.]|nr:SapC family protein [Phenylobacterium sp.]MDO8408718.1 SapC family protein [Phenylobacterium sp.]
MTLLFYENIAPITFAQHGTMRLRTPLDYGFAGGANAVPLTLSEIPLAAPWYPIAFSREPRPRPLAILGLREGENLFVDSKGRWREGAYVPIYVRRFPFVLGQEGELITLCIENRPEVLSETAGKPLFDGDRPSALLESAMTFCRSAQAAERATIPFVEQLLELDLLESRTAVVEVPEGAKVSLSGFLTIDESRFRGLSDEVFLDLRRRGWLAAIYAQMQAALNWGRLADRLGDRQAA